MACKYIYKGTTYTKEQFESFVKEEFVKMTDYTIQNSNLLPKF